MDVYDALNTIVTTFVANIPKISVLIFLLGIVHSQGIPTGEASWTNVFLVSSFLSLVVGTVVGLVQFRIKKLLAYSGVSHMGFLLLALAGYSLESSQALLFYLTQYIITNVGIFFILVLIGSFLQERRLNSFLMDREHSPLQLISQLKGYFYYNPLLALSFAALIFSLMGIPPLLGFFGKQLVLSAALQEGHIFLSIIAILTSVVGAVYYLHLVKSMFFFSPDESQVKQENGPKNKSRITPKVLPSSSLTITISIITLVNLLFILNPNIWLSTANKLAFVLFNP